MEAGTGYLGVIQACRNVDMDVKAQMELEPVREVKSIGKHFFRDTGNKGRLISLTQFLIIMKASLQNQTLSRSNHSIRPGKYERQDVCWSFLLGKGDSL